MVIVATQAHACHELLVNGANLQVVANSRALGEALKKRGYKLVTDGTDNHLLLWDLRGEGISGAKMEKACDEAHITLNKNAVVGDVSAMNPGGVRIGELQDSDSSACQRIVSLIASLLVYCCGASLVLHSEDTV